MRQRVGVARQASVWLLLALTYGAGGCAWTGEPAGSALLPEAQFGKGACYEVIRHNTCYPESPDFTTGIDDYDSLPWLRLLLNTEQIPSDWESRLARARRWAYVVDTRKRGPRLDSLLLRFTVGTRTIQITDNRTNFILAVLAPEEHFSTENPEETVRALCREYLAEQFTESWQMRFWPAGGDSGVLWGGLWHADVPHLAPVGCCAFYVGPTFAAFAFRKSHPLTAVERRADTRGLFTDKAAPPLPPEAIAVRAMLMEKRWDPDALAAALRVLEGTWLQNAGRPGATAPRPAELDAIANTLECGYGAFGTRLQGLREGDPTAYDVVAGALTAFPSADSRMRYYARDMLPAVAVAAQRLQDVRLASPLLNRIRNEKSPDGVACEADALCAIMKEGSAEALLPLIRESDATSGEPARRIAVMLKALGEYPTEALLAEAEAMAGKAEDPAVRKAALAIIGEAAGRENGDRVAAWRALLRRAATNDPSWPVRLVAVDGLGQLADRSALTDLVPSFADECLEVQFAAARWYAIRSGWDAPSGAPSRQERERFLGEVLGRIASAEVAAAARTSADADPPQASMAVARMLYGFDAWKDRERLPGKHLDVLPDVAGLLQPYGRVEAGKASNQRSRYYDVTTGLLRRTRTEVRLSLADSAFGAKQAILRGFAMSTCPGRHAVRAAPGSWRDIGDLCLGPEEGGWTSLDCARANVCFSIRAPRNAEPEAILDMARVIDAELVRLLEGEEKAPEAICRGLRPQGFILQERVVTVPSETRGVLLRTVWPIDARTGALGAPVTRTIQAYGLEFSKSSEECWAQQGDRQTGRLDLSRISCPDAAALERCLESLLNRYPDRPSELREPTVGDRTWVGRTRHATTVVAVKGTTVARAWVSSDFRDADARRALADDLVRRALPVE